MSKHKAKDVNLCSHLALSPTWKLISENKEGLVMDLPICSATQNAWPSAPSVLEESLALQRETSVQDG